MTYKQTDSVCWVQLHILMVWGCRGLKVSFTITQLFQRLTSLLGSPWIIPTKQQLRRKQTFLWVCNIRGYIGLLNNSLAWNIKFWLFFAIWNSQSQTCSFLIQDVRTRTMTEAHLPRHHLPPSAKLWRAHYRIIVITLPFLTAGWNFYSVRQDDWKNITEEYGEASNRVFICGIKDKKKKNRVEDNLKVFF